MVVFISHKLTNNFRFLTPVTENYQTELSDYFSDILTINYNTAELRVYVGTVTGTLYQILYYIKVGSTNQLVCRLQKNSN